MYKRLLLVARALRSLLPEAETAVELGGEDAKITWLGSSPEQRMNGVCAGGTGAFIDHMASLLGTTAPDLAVWQKAQAYLSDRLTLWCFC